MNEYQQELAEELAREHQMENEVCVGMCPNLNGNCPNVKSYADGSPRKFHTEVKCSMCGDKWFIGISWDGNLDGEFRCTNCTDKLNRMWKEALILKKEHHIKTCCSFCGGAGQVETKEQIIECSH